MMKVVVVERYATTNHYIRELFYDQDREIVARQLEDPVISRVWHGIWNMLDDQLNEELGQW